MPANVEIKAHVRNKDELHRRAAALSDTPVQVLWQEDTFFHCTNGRLKLRQQGEDEGQLVWYERPDAKGPKRSNYLIARSPDPQALKTLLETALGVRGVVRKKRHLYLAGQTRIHVDEVEGLGNFMELEVVLSPGQSTAEGQEIASELMKALGISPADLLEGAYMDLLEGR